MTPSCAERCAESLMGTGSCIKPGDSGTEVLRRETTVAESHRERVMTQQVFNLLKTRAPPDRPGGGREAPDLALGALAREFLQPLVNLRYWLVHPSLDVHYWLCPKARSAADYARRVVPSARQRVPTAPLLAPGSSLSPLSSPSPGSGKYPRSNMRYRPVLW